ncbi:MAG: TauD/TfdA family dioxygenase [Litorimonas sp.]
MAESLDTRGYFFSSENIFADYDPAEELIKLAQKMGQVRTGRFGSLVEVLSPLDSTNAQTNSLSAVHGQDEFPYHVDGSHLASPSRYLLLFCSEAKGAIAPTHILHRRDLDLHADIVEAMRAGVFLVRNGKRSFYASILSDAVSFMRWDAGCMFPKDSRAMKAAEALLQPSTAMKKTTINWQAGALLIIDNWSVLHARGPIVDRTSRRELLRVSVQ